MRDLIVRTASDLLTRRYSCDVSVDEIAAVAGIVCPQLEAYFGTVEEILCAVAEAQMHSTRLVADRNGPSAASARESRQRDRWYPRCLEVSL